MYPHTLHGILFSLLVTGMLSPDRTGPQQVAAQETPADVEGVHLLRIQSDLLTAFWGRPMYLEAGVVLPPEDKRDPAGTPVCYSIHGFGGSHRVAWRAGPRLREQIAAGQRPPMIYAFLNAQFSLGHHEFADSVNNGPWGQALLKELVPALEKKFQAAAVPGARFLTGHSSGGWSSLWLQITYPDFFGGTWSTAPDPVDFRDFTGIDIYRFPNAYEDPEGNKIQLMRRQGKFVLSIQDYVKSEIAKRDYGGQFASFDAVFSPRGEDGRPQPLFDRKSGKINHTVAKAWEKYDIRLILKRNWEQLQPKIQGKLRIYMGTLDTFRLEGALRLLDAGLKELKSDAQVVFIEGRDHGTLLQPHPELWPRGLRTEIHQQMWKRWQQSQ